MSKRLRTSFNQFVREKVIQGVDNMYPEAENMPLNLLVPDITSYGGFVEYQETEHYITGSTAGNFYIQGPMGYGPPPTGPGTEPFKCFLSNKILNTSASDLGAMTGDPSVTPHVKLDNIHYSGVACTFSVGLAMQFRYAADPSVKLDKDMGQDVTEHSLVTLHHFNSTTTPVADPLTDIKFMYHTTSDLGFQLSIVAGDGTVLVAAQSFNHMVNAYGRMLPVHMELQSDGSGEFRVDNAKLLFDITTLGYVMPTQDTVSITVAGLSPAYSTSTVFGMQAPISRLTNVAVNDNNPSPCVDDVGLPSFIHGVSCTPIRKAVDPADSNWEMPASVQDGMDAWTPFAENSPTVSYGLNAIMDNQTYETRGVATDTLSADLDIAITKQTFEDRIDGAAVTDEIEAINLLAYNAATFDGSDFAVQIAGHTDWTVFPGLYDDPTIDSHLTFFNKPGADCPQFMATDFNSDLVFKLRAQESGIVSTNESGGVTAPAAPAAPTTPATPTLPVGLIGECIINEDGSEEYVQSISMNATGDRVVLGGPNYEHGTGYTFSPNPALSGMGMHYTNKLGRVKVYQWDGTSWSQLGSEILGDRGSDEFGESVSMNSTGDRIIIGAVGYDGPPGSNGTLNGVGHARVYQWDGTSWTQLGADIMGAAKYEQFGEDVSINSAGDRVAISAAEYGTDRGLMRIFQWDGTSWAQLGADIVGESQGDDIYKIDLNAAGDRAVVSWSDYDNNRGVTRIFQWDGTSWTQLGADIKETQIDASTGLVDLNAAGDRVAIGSVLHSGPVISGADSLVGTVKILEWDGVNWTQLGNNIHGSANNEYAGVPSLNDTGDRVAIGARLAGSNNRGRTRVYQWDGLNWVQVGTDIEPTIAYEYPHDQFGHAVQLNAVGDRLAVASLFGSGMDGYACVYQLESV